MKGVSRTTKSLVESVLGVHYWDVDRNESQYALDYTRNDDDKIMYQTSIYNRNSDVS